MSTHNIPFSIYIKENQLKLSPICSYRTQRRGRNNHDKRAMSVRATEFLLYICLRLARLMPGRVFGLFFFFFFFFHAELSKHVEMGPI